jgi:3-oxoacyl-[acyl-carrier-protein] synthase-1
MVTGVGLTSPSSCAAIRCGIDNFQETRFMDNSGEWITGSYVSLDPPWRGRAKLVNLVAPAIRECMNTLKNEDFERIPLLICVAEKDRPGGLDGLDDHLLDEVQDELKTRFHEKSAIIPQGRVGGVTAVKMAMDLLYQSQLPYCIVAGADSFLVAGTLAAFEKKDRLLTESNSDGFIPGEAGAAVLLCAGNQKYDEHMDIKGIGFGKEDAFIDSGEPLRADGLVQAIREASISSNMTIDDLDYRMTDANGEQYGFKEAALAMTRALRKRKEEFDIWHPAECVGEVGAAIVPITLGVADTASKKGYAPGKSVLCHFANDDGQRAVMFLRFCDSGGA